MHSVIKLANAGASQITVTSTATSLEDLITTAAGADFTLDDEINALDLQVETESVRYLSDGNTPTASKGFLMSSSDISVRTFRGETIKKLKLIRAGGTDATVNIQLGKIVR